MAQQRISTPSVIDIRDSVILSANSVTNHLAIALRDPWDLVLSKLEPYALDPDLIVPAMDNALLPSATNPFVSRSHFERRMGIKNFKLIGPPGSGADFEGLTHVAFRDALLEASTVVVLPGTYTFGVTVEVPEGSRVLGSHPSAVICTSSDDITIFRLEARASIEALTIDAPEAVSVPAVSLSGEKSFAHLINVKNFQTLGFAAAGAKSFIKNCRVESTDGLAVLIQSPQVRVEYCSFNGTMASGAVRVESSEATVTSNFFSQTLTAYSYYVASPSLFDTKIIANNFASIPSLDASIDLGTGTVRYANTPNTLHSNYNNALDSLQTYSGQESLTDSEADLTNTFTHDPSAIKDVTSIWSSFDLFLQRSYEERNFFFTSDDPVFDNLGAPTAGVFQWEGTTQTISWPEFRLRSVHRQGSWLIPAGSSQLQAGEALVLNLDQDLDAADISLIPTEETRPLPLAGPEDSQQVVLAIGLGGQNALWLSSFRLLTQLTSFDVDGTPLPMTRYVGVSESRNPVRRPATFVGREEADLRELLSAQNAAIRNLYEETNLQLSGGEYDSLPTRGPWLTDAALSSGLLGQTPSHLCQLSGTAYALIPTAGLYEFRRDSNGWSPVVGLSAVGPWTSLSYYKTGLALLRVGGELDLYDNGQWSSVTPATLELRSPLTATVPVAGYQETSQRDYAAQTSQFTLFTTVDGRTVAYDASKNILRESFERIYSETSEHFIARHPKDSGFNLCLKDPLAGVYTDDNGAGSVLSGLPLANIENYSLIRNETNVNVASVNFEACVVEHFIVDSQGVFLAVLKDASSLYFLGGGPGSVSLYSVFKTASEPFLAGAVAQSWALDTAAQTFYGSLRVTATNTLRVITGSSANGRFAWTTQDVSTAGACQQVIASLVDEHDVHILTSDLTRSSRPTWFRRPSATGLWITSTLTATPAGGTDVNVPAAVANSAGITSTGHGTASKDSVQFLIQDTARSNAGTFYAFSKQSLAFSSLFVTGSLAVDASLGAALSPSTQVSFFLTRPATPNTVVVHSFFSPLVSSSVTIGAGGTQLATTSLGSYPTSRRSGSYIGATASKVAIFTPGVGTIQLDNPPGSILYPVPPTYSIADRRTDLSMPPLSGMRQIRPGVFRAGELSYQITSFIDSSLPLLGGSTIEFSGTLRGLPTFELGSKVRNIADGLWVGFNRGGYPWIFNAAMGNKTNELTPALGTSRGDTIVPSLGAMAAGTDFDAAYSATSSQLIIVYRDAMNLGKLAVVIYNALTNAVVLERSGFLPMIGTYDVPLASTPRVATNVFASAFDIVSQDDTRVGGQFVHFRRTFAGVWTGDRVGQSGDKPVPSLTANNGIRPSRPLALSNGDILVATERGTAKNLHVALRTNAGAWTTAYQTTSGGGYGTPQLGQTLDGLVYWAVGSSDGTTAAISKSNSVSSGWSNFTNAEQAIYSRIKNVSLRSYQDRIVVAGALAAEGTTPADQELAVFEFTNANGSRVDTFSSLGRLAVSANNSGEEETTLQDISFNHAGAILYGAMRPTRTVPHYSLRSSKNAWAKPAAESFNGSGRMLTIGGSTFREQNSRVASVVEVYLDKTFVKTWPNILPIATGTKPNEYLTLAWPSSATSVAAPVFSLSEGVSITAEPELPSSTMPSARAWPRIYGNTSWTYTAGPAIFSQGSMLRLLPPTGGASYFGSVGLIKLRADPTITLRGMHSYRSGAREFTIVGPLSIKLDPLAAQGQTLVFEFATPTTLVLDPSAHPLSYWLELDTRLETYPVAIGQTRQQEFQLTYFDTPLTYGHLEPRELIADRNEWTYSAGRFDERAFFQAPTYYLTNGYNKNVSVTVAGSLRGFQEISFASSLTTLQVRERLPQGGLVFKFVSPSVRGPHERAPTLASNYAGVVESPYFN